MYTTTFLSMMEIVGKLIKLADNEAYLYSIQISVMVMYMVMRVVCILRTIPCILFELIAIIRIEAPCKTYRIPQNNETYYTSPTVFSVSYKDVSLSSSHLQMKPNES